MIKTTIKYGGIDLPFINSSDELVPTEATKIDLPLQDKKALGIATRDNLPALLIGETGTGKTSAIKELAFLLKQPYVRINMTGFTTPDELIGSKSVKEGATYYEDGIITNAMKRGAILVIDEINATTPDCLFILHGLLDDDKRITLPNGDIINPDPNFRVFATCNPDYEGTRSMNKAFMDRFAVILWIDVLEPKKEVALLVSKSGIDEQTAMNLVAVATICRKEYTEGKLVTFVSTRTLINLSKLIIAGIEPRKAFQMGVCQKTTNKEEQKLLEDFFLSVFKLAKGSDDGLDVPYITTKREINELTVKASQADEILAKTANQLRETVEEMVNTKTLLDELANEKINMAKKYEDLEAKNKEINEKLKAYSTLEDIIKKASMPLT